MSKKRRITIDAIDQVSARLHQASAAVMALRMTFGDGRDDESKLSNFHMCNLLWGISEQLRDAEKALDEATTKWERDVLEAEAARPRASKARIPGRGRQHAARSSLTEFGLRSGGGLRLAPFLSISVLVTSWPRRNRQHGDLQS